MTASDTTQDAFEHGYRRAADLRAERDVLASIVRDLAAAAAFDECVFCPTTNGRLDPTTHTDSCPDRRAREWVQAQEHNE